MKRKWESEVWILIVFAVTIIIAVGFLWMLWFFYKKYLDNKKYISILWNQLSKLSDVNAIWLCKTSSFSKISYDPVNDRYKLTCSWKLWKNFNYFEQYGISVYSGWDINDNFCEYKIRK